LKWADEIGIKKCATRIDNLYKEYHEDRYRLSTLIRKMAKKNQTFY